jgi:hypothetical protein
LLRLFEIRSVEERRGFISRREEEPAILIVRHRRRRHLELRDEDPVDRLFVLANAGASHEEFAAGDENALERLVRTC